MPEAIAPIIPGGIAFMPPVQFSIMRDHMRMQSSGLSAGPPRMPLICSARCAKPSIAQVYARCQSSIAVLQYCSQSACWKCAPLSSSFMLPFSILLHSRHRLFPVIRQ